MGRETWKKRAARICYLAFVLFGVSLASFFLSALAPGDPAEIILRGRAEAPGPEQIAALRKELGLDDPWPVQYLAWMQKVLCMDLGTSWVTGRPVAREIRGRLGATVELALAAFGLSVVLACACGGVGALCQNRLPDLIIQCLAFLVTAMPAFWLGVLMIYLFSMKLHLLPVAGRGGIRHLVLPALTLALGIAFVQANVLRAVLIRICSQDHIRFARARGLGWRIIFYRHILPGALAPMVTLWGVSLGQLLGGAVIVETVFAWPGIGRMLAESVMARDVPCIQSLVLLMAVAFVLVNGLADRVRHRLDPRLQREL